MIDFHSHVLPKVDDGSQSLDETRQMLALSYQQGVRHMVATPHFYADEMIPEAFLEKRQRAFDQIKPDDSAPVLHLGAEVAYFDHMSRSDAMQQLQIDNTGLLLVEMPFADWTDRIAEEICMLQDRQGLTPVLAHVERYRQKNQFPRYRDMFMNFGVLFQCNASAFLRPVMDPWALKQLRIGCVHLLGSDCHNLGTRAPQLGEAARMIEKKLGCAALEEIKAFSAEALHV